MGRIDSADVFKDGHAHWPSGYIFRIRPNGGWELLSAAYGKRPVLTLVSGTVNIKAERWHHLELRFHGKRIVALFDGTQLATVEDATHAHGMFGLGSEWGHTQFDNLRVAP
jgi:hypothetical protein